MTTENDAIVQFIKAVEKCIPCLSEDAISMGFGQSFREHMDALTECLKALDAHSDLCRVSGIRTAGALAWPRACELVKEYRGR